MEINDEMIKQSYFIAKQVFEKKLTLIEGAAFLKEKYNMNDASAKYYINDYRYMRTSKPYAQTMKGNATKYYLQNIYNDFGYDALQTALQAVDLHIVYYETLDNGKLNNIRKIYEEFLKIEKPNNYNNEFIDESENLYTEGKVKKVFVNIYERDREARKKCLEHYGYKCTICGIKLSDIYGVIADNFIEVHHLKELSSIKREYEINPIEDMRVLCPNCHAIVHRKTPALSIEEVKKMINK
jgi:5-methylcytosine-specific restriction protein A